MRQIQAYSMGNGYDDFPYGLAVFPSGRVYEGRDLGYVCGGTTAEEAATAANNGTSVAVVWPGNYERQQPTPMQIEATAKCIETAQFAGIVTMTPNLRGHRDVYQTACPGAYAYPKLPAIRTALAAHPLAVPPAPAKPVPQLPKLTTAQAQVVKKLIAMEKTFEKRPAVAGEASDRVRWLQTLLHIVGCYDQPTPTGTFGTVMVRGVAKFKGEHPELGNVEGRRVGAPCVGALLKAVAAHPATKPEAK